MAKITYTDKEALNEIPSIPAKNKVQANDMNEIKNVVNQNELKILLIVDSSAPAECSTGDMYYNTTTKLIYTATGTNTWGSTGVNPTQNTLYIDSTNKSTYFYDGNDLISVGGGAGGESLKIGTIVPFAGSTIPDGYLTCDGTAVSRTTYSDLFAVIGTTYGSGDGSATFNLPNLKGRVPVGLDGTQTEFDTLGETGGSKTHVHLLPLGADSNSIYASINETTEPLVVGTGGGKYASFDGATGSSINAISSKEASSLQPYLVVHYIIKATKTTPIQAEVVNTQSNSTTDAYSCEYVNKALVETYSTDEVKTNKVWIDGKPIYRKVIAIGSITGSVQKTGNTGIVNCEYANLISTTGIASNGANKNINNAFIYDNGTHYSAIDNDSCTNVNMIIEYTKTTD